MSTKWPWHDIAALPNDERLILAHCPPDEAFLEGRTMIWRASMLFEQFARIKKGIPQPSHLSFPATLWADVPAPGAAEGNEAWRYAINYGPDGEQNYAMVYDEHGCLVGNLHTHHAIAVVAAQSASNGRVAELRQMSDAHREHAQSAVEHSAALNRLLAIAEARAEAAEAEVSRLKAAFRDISSFSPEPASHIGPFEQIARHARATTLAALSNQAGASK